MADAIDITPTPAKRGRKPGAGKAASSKAAAPKTTARKTAPKAASAKRASPARASKSAAAPTFAESAQQARAALHTASAAARAKVKDASAKAKSTKETVSAFDWKAQGEQVKSQAGKMARDAAGTAKVKTGEAMEGLAKLIAETAQTVDTKLGPQYGDYARQAANAVAGAAKSLDKKDVDQLLGDARDFVRKSPAVAIGAAAIAGYVLMRLAKGSGSDDT